MYKKNPNIVECPIHGLHYDQTKQDACALCLRQEEERAWDKKEEKKSSGLFIILIVSALLGAITWASLHYGFPPPATIEESEDKIPLTYEEPFGWNKEDITGRLIALDRMGLHTPDSPWSIKDRFTYYSKSGIQNQFIEYIQVLKGPGAYLVDQNIVPEIQKKIKEQRPTAVMEPMIVSSELVDVAGTRGVLTNVSYQSDDIRYQALVYYIPAGNHHYWVTLAAQLINWDRYEQTFQNFIASLEGGKQGKELKTSLPHFLLSPYRSVWAGMAMFLVSLWIITFIAFRKEKQRQKRKATYRESDKRKRHLLKE